MLNLNFYKITFLLIFALNLIPNNKQEQSNNQNNTVLLTGAAGFIGSNFLKYMFEKYPTYHFLVLDALTYAGSLDNIPEEVRKSDRFEFYYGSVTNPDMVDYLMSRSDFVVHFAAETHVTRSIYDDRQFFETDVIGTRTMMHSLVKHNRKVKRFIHISTSEVLGTAETEPMDENHPLNPMSPYAAAKTGADRLVYAYWSTFDVPAVIIRPFNNYGPQQHIEKVIPRFIASAIKKEPLTIHGSGLQERDWIHTLDTAKSLDKVLHTENFDQIKNQVIHIGSGKGTSILDIAKLILEKFDLPEEKYLKFVGDRPGQVRCHISSTQKAKNLLEWQTTITLEEGIVDTIEWYKKNRDRWEKMEIFMQVPITTENNTVEYQ